MTFVPSKFQKTVYTYITKGRGNAIIDAVAGSGKSTTIVNALKLIPTQKRVLFLAFNKSIVEELKVKIGDMENVDVKTLHSLGAGAIRKSCDSKIDVGKYRTYINDNIIGGFFAPTVTIPAEHKDEWKQNILKLVDLGRVNLIESEKELDELAFKHNLMVYDNEISLALRTIQWGKRNIESIDFTDMIYFPNVLDIRMFKYDWVFVDECQDLNAAQREMVLKCVKSNGRFVAVGDPRQAIYGFAGADIESFNLLKNLPHTGKLPLSICYRCDKEIVKLAQTIVPQIQWREGAEDGVVNHDAMMQDVKDGDMVLCRVSAPLTKLCMHYIASGIKAYVKGRDIGANLINMIKKTKRNNMTDVMEILNRELGRIIGKVIAKTHCTQKEATESDVYVNYKDKLDSIDIMSDGLVTANEVINRIEEIFKDDSKEGICLSTIHKSKGLESDRVFIICEDKLYLKSCMKVEWMAEQERNLVYVAYTRAKHYLGFIQDFKV